MHGGRIVTPSLTCGCASRPAQPIALTRFAALKKFYHMGKILRVYFSQISCLLNFLKNYKECYNIKQGNCK